MKALQNSIGAIAVLILTIAISAFAINAFAAPAEKITICHVPPGNPANAHSITISRNAWEAGHNPHNAHALDYEGSCNVPEPTATDVPNDPRPTATPRPLEGSPTPVIYATAIPVCGTESACSTCDELREMNTYLSRIADALEAANE